MRDAAAQSSSPTGRSLWIEALLHPSVWKRALTLGLPVGLLQAIINQGDFWWRHAVDGAVVAKTIISPLVTFSVALLSAAATYVQRKRTIKAQKQEVIHVFEPKHYDRIEI